MDGDLDNELGEEITRTICIIPQTPAASANPFSANGWANPAIPAGEIKIGKEVDSPIISQEVLHSSTSIRVRGRKRIEL